MVAVDDIRLVTQLPQNAWFEGFAMRPNGHILVSRLDEPTLYTFDAEDRDASPLAVHTFTDATGLINLCPLQGRHDEYLLISGRPDIDAMAFNDRDYAMWKVVFTSATDVTITKVTDLPGYGFAIGSVQASEHTFLIADSLRSCVWSLDIRTGTSTLLIQDESMKAVEGEAFGLNRMCLVEGHVWFTNTSAGTFNRFPIAVDGETVTVTGPVQLLSNDIEHCDGLAVAPDASAAWTASMQNDWLWQIDLDRVDDGDDDQIFASTSVVKEGIYSPTAVELATVAGSPRLYVVCNGDRQEQQAWIKKGDANPWIEFQNVTKSVEVSITVDE